MGPAMGRPSLPTGSTTCFSDFAGGPAAQGAWKPRGEVMGSAVPRRPACSAQQPSERSPCVSADLAARGLGA